MRNAYVSIFVAAIVLLLTSSVLGANNPADLTVDSRVYLMRYFKASYDDGPWYTLTIQQIGDRSSVSACSWHDENGETSFFELIASTRIAKGIEAGFVRYDWHGPEDQATAMLDISDGKIGLGIMLPVSERKDKVILGPRFCSGDWTGYATVVDGGKPLFGIGRYKDGYSLDFAAGKGLWWFRASRLFTINRKTIIPELRLRGSEEETHIGFGIGMCY